MKKILSQPCVHVKKQFFIFFTLFFGQAVFSPSFTGTITDAGNKPISKVKVQVKGTSRRTLNNNAGKFCINASGNNVLF